MLAAAAARNRDAACVHVWPLGRFGFTAAKLFQLRFDKRGIGQPWVMKVSLASAIDTECTAMKAAGHFLSGAQSYSISAPGGATDDTHQLYRALLYELVGSAPGPVITELKDLYLSDTFDADDARLCGVLQKLYHHHLPAADSVAYQTRSLGAEYKRYLRGNRPDRLVNLFGPSTDAVSLFGERYLHPTKALRAITQRRVSLGVAPVHGDLHPSNVVLTADDAPQLIDFAWFSEEGHVLKDYVLMECSLRFLYFPDDVDWQTHHEVTRLLVFPDGPGRVLSFIENIPGTPHASRYRRMARAVACIREAANARTPGSPFAEYLLAQYLVLYGLSRIREYPIHLVADALGTIANQLGVSAS
jgi:hypothetical protein